MDYCWFGWNLETKPRQLLRNDDFSIFFVQQGLLACLAPLGFSKNRSKLKVTFHLLIEIDTRVNATKTISISFHFSRIVPEVYQKLQKFVVGERLEIVKIIMAKGSKGMDVFEG